MSEAVYTGPIFDGDSHEYEVDDAFMRHLPEKYREDWGIRWQVGEDGQYAMYVGKRKVHPSAGYYTADGLVPPPGRLHEWLRAMKAGGDVEMRVPRTPDMSNRDARLAKLDEFGVEASLVFGSVAWIGYMDEREPANAVYHAYNRFVLDDWGFNFQDRIYHCPLISLDDPDNAVKEAEWLVKNGVRVVTMPMGPANKRSPADPFYDRFWSVLNDAEVRVAYHVSEARFMHTLMVEWGEKGLTSRQKQTAWVWMNAYSEVPVVQTLSSFIFYNFFERFPNVKLLSVENGAEWVPAMLTKMDKVRGMAKNGYWPCGQLKSRPSHIFRQNVFVVAYPEDDLQSIAEQIGGVECILMGSDYPHAEGVPAPRDFVKEACGGLSPEQIRAVMYDNGRRFLPKAG